MLNRVRAKWNGVRAKRIQQIQDFPPPQNNNDQQHKFKDALKQLQRDGKLFPMEVSRAYCDTYDNTLTSWHIGMIMYSISQGESTDEDVNQLDIQSLHYILHMMDSGDNTLLPHVSFSIFDDKSSGVLDHEQFHTMMRIIWMTHVKDLSFVLATSSGKYAFLHHLIEHRVEENYYFWNAACRFRVVKSAAPSLPEARSIFSTFIQSGPQMARINDITANTIHDVMINSEMLGGEPITYTLFEEAEREVFDIMSTVFFDDFCQKSTSVEFMLGSFFREVDTNYDEVIKLSEFVKWMELHPNPLYFIHDFDVMIRSIIDFYSKLSDVLL
jgi:hypothetical protein